MRAEHTDLTYAASVHSSFEADEDHIGRQNGIKVRQMTYLRSLELSILYAFRSLRRARRVFLIGLVATALVVWFLTFLQNIIQQSPIIFFRLAETTAGELDLVYTPAPNINNQSIFVNTTFIANALDRRIVDSRKFYNNETMTMEFRPPYTGNGFGLANASAPRWLGLGNLRNRDFPGLNSSVKLVLMDTELEESVGIGRNWPYRSLGEAEAHVAASLLRGIGIRPNRGDRAVLQIDLIGVISAATGNTQDDLNAIMTSILAGFGLDLGLIDQIAQFQAALFPLLDSFANATINTNITIPGPLIRGILEQLNITGVNVPDELVIPEDTVRALQDQVRNTMGAFPFNITNSTSADAIAATLVSIARSALIVEQEITVVEDMGNPVGRWPNALGNVVLLDSLYAMQILKNNVRRAFALAESTFGISFSLIASSLNLTMDTVDAYLDRVHLNDYSLLTVVQYRDRLTGYTSTGQALTDHMIDFSNEAMEALGQNFTATPTLPVYTAVEASLIVRLFLDQLFLAVVLVLSFLGCLLIYQLIINDIDEKTYEYGMLRALGMRKRGLIQLITVQSSFFSLPGICLGFLLAFLISIYPTYYISRFGSVEPFYGLRGMAVFAGFMIGALMPLVSSVLPVRRALNRTLRDSLDVYHQVANDISVRFTKLAEIGLQPWQITVALLLIVTGFTVYYMFPYAIVYQDFSLILTLLLAIVMGMVMGFILLSQILLPILDRGLLKICVLPQHRNLMTLIRQHQASHRSRNSKAALMFTTALSFLIFAGTMFALQAVSIPDNLRVFLGADLVITSPNYATPLDETGMRSFLDREKARGAASRVRGYSFLTFSLTDWSGATGMSFSALSSWPQYGIDMFGIDETFLEGVYSDVFITSELESGVSFDSYKGTTDVPKSLYQSSGSKDPFASMGVPAPPASSIVTGQSFSKLVANYSGTATPFPIPINGNDDDSQKNVFDVRPMQPGDIYRRTIPLIMSEALRAPAGIDTGVPLRMSVDFHAQDSVTLQNAYFSRPFLGRARAMVRKVPGFYYTAYRFGAGISPILVSNNDFTYITDTLINSLIEYPPLSQIEMLRNYLNNNSTASNATRAASGGSDIHIPPKSRLFVRLRENISTKDKEFVINSLKGFIKDDITSTTDTLALIESTKTATDMIQLFFLVVGVLTLVLAFFVLLTTFEANVKENAWEFGVLRAIGVSVRQLQVSYIYESLTLVLSSIILGTLIGVILSITLTLQFNVFLESPFHFNFPFMIVFVMDIISLIGAFFGSYLPVRRLNSMQIASVIRQG